MVARSDWTGLTSPTLSTKISKAGKGLRGNPPQIPQPRTRSGDGTGPVEQLVPSLSS